MMSQHTAAVPPEAERGVRHDVRPLMYIVLRNPFRSRPPTSRRWLGPVRPFYRVKETTVAVTPTCPVRYDPLDEATLADPYPVLAALRAQAPLVWHDTMESWLVTGYDDCVRVLRDHEAFARDPRRLGRTVPEASLSVQVLDPPHQAAVRSAFMTSLHAQDLPVLQERTRRDIAARLEVLASQPAWDVMRELAQPVALDAIADLLGVTPPPLSAWVQVSDTIMRSMDGGLNPDLVEPGRLAREKLSELVASWFTTTGSPAGLLGHVRTRTADAGPELARYVVHTARVMFQGGYSTLAAAIGNAVDTLARNPQPAGPARTAREAAAAGHGRRRTGPLRRPRPGHQPSRRHRRPARREDGAPRREGDGAVPGRQPRPRALRAPGPAGAGPLAEPAPRIRLGHPRLPRHHPRPARPGRAPRRPRRPPGPPAPGRPRAATTHRHHAGLRPAARHPPALTRIVTFPTWSMR